MKLKHCLLACNENTKYLHYWPFVKRAWKQIVGIDVTMIYIGESLHEELENDPCVTLFKPVSNIPTATQAQMIRLLYPALIKTDGAVVISDMDCIPLNADFFHRGFSDATANQFVSLKAPMEDSKQVVMCYVGAMPAVWGDMFRIKDLDDVRAKMEMWSGLYTADENHGGVGWCSDQLELYSRVKDWEESCPERLNISKWAWDFPRLDRGMPHEWIEMNPHLESRIRYRHYVDFHMPPIEEFREQIIDVLRVATVSQY